MVIYCPNYAHRIPNVVPGLIFGGLIIGKIVEFVYRGLVGLNWEGSLYSGVYGMCKEVHAFISGHFQNAEGKYETIFGALYLFEIVIPISNLCTAPLFLIHVKSQPSSFS